MNQRALLESAGLFVMVYLALLALSLYFGSEYAGFMLLVEMLDVPLILLDSAQDLMMANLPSADFSLLVGWMNFLNGGRRPALSLFAAMMAVVCSRFFYPEHGQQSVSQ